MRSNKFAASARDEAIRYADQTLHLQLAGASNAVVRNRLLDEAVRSNYRCFVVIEWIRGFNHAVPFVPYESHTVSGETYEIPHPDFIFVSPRGSYVVVVDPKDPKDIPHHVSALLIERASLVNGQKRRRSRKR